MVVVVVMQPLTHLCPILPWPVLRLWHQGRGLPAAFACGEVLKGGYQICRRHKDCEGFFRATVLTPGGHRARR